MDSPSVTGTSTGTGHRVHMYRKLRSLPSTRPNPVDCTARSPNEDNADNEPCAQYSGSEPLTNNLCTRPVSRANKTRLLKCCGGFIGRFAPSIDVVVSYIRWDGDIIKFTTFYEWTSIIRQRYTRHLCAKPDWSSILLRSQQFVVLRWFDSQNH